MKIKKVNRRFIIGLISLTIIISVAVTGSIINIIRETSYEQFNEVSNMSIHLFKERIERLIPTDLSFIYKNEDTVAKLNKIYSKYDIDGSTFSSNLSQILPMNKFTVMDRTFSIDSPVEMSLGLLSEDGIIIASSVEEYIGLKFFINDYINQENITQFLLNPSSRILTLLENVKNLWFNFYIIIPMNNIDPMKKHSQAYLTIMVKHLDSKPFMAGLRRNNEDGWLHKFNSSGEILFTYPNKKEFSESIIYKQPQLLTNRDQSIKLSKPYINHDGIDVIAATAWLESLNMGIIVEKPTRSIFAPWLNMTGLILVVMTASFLIFLMIMIILNKKRIDALDHNPLTHLPGNRRVIEKIRTALQSGEDMMVIYFDLDNFKAYNDLYGFSAGDDVISFSASILLRFFKPSRRLFLGHIGGDDFIVIGPSDTLEQNANFFGKAFDKEITSFYNEEDQKKGCISSKNRQNENQIFPFIAMSMGGIKLKVLKNIHPLRVTEICAEVKKEAKKKKGSILILEQRKI